MPKWVRWRDSLRQPEVLPPERVAACAECPFKGGMNQLWRNTLLALAVEDDPRTPYDYVRFSVVHHPGNHSLEPTMKRCDELTADSKRFSWFTSDLLVNAAAATDSTELREWAAWYRMLYRV